MRFIFATRCLQCRLESTIEPRTIRIGPIGDQIITGYEFRDGFRSPIVEYLYKGSILNVICPFCVLNVAFPSDLAWWSLADYIEEPRSGNSDLDLNSLFQRGRLREFPLPCPRCAREIAEPGMKKRCRECGADQVQVLGRVVDSGNSND